MIFLLERVPTTGTSLMSLAGEHQGSPGRWTGWNPSEKNHDPTGDDFSRMGA